MIKIIDYTKEPLSRIGEVASFCWGSSPSKDIGKKCLASNHGRTFEFVDVTISIEGYSARMIRELFRHVIGTSFLQESTRYVNCKEFDFYIPTSIKAIPEAETVYDSTMAMIQHAYKSLQEYGIPKEDIANILPLGMTSKVVYKINLRAILHMFEIRTCSRAYHEYRDFMKELKEALSSLDGDWKFIIDTYAKTKCEMTGYCKEDKSCGRYPKK